MILISRTKTQREFEKEVFDKVGDEYTVLGKYTKAKDKILFRHNSIECNYSEFYKKPDDFLRGHMCIKCGIQKGRNNHRKTHDEFCQEVFNLVGDEYTVLEEYKGCDIDILFRHNNKSCENSIFFKTPWEFLQGYMCTKCGINQRTNAITKTSEEFKMEVYNIVSNEYDVLGEYKNAKTNIKMRHNNESCKFYTWEVNPQSFLDGSRCPKCAGNAKKTDEEFKLELNEKLNGEYTSLEKYKGDKYHIKMKHNLCNNEWFVTPSNILKGFGCPVCNESKGEKAIRHYLNNNNISFESQYTFDNLIGVRNGLLKFDFSIFNDIQKEKILFLIEYDGIFHYKKQYSEDGYEILQIHDHLKTEYCKNNNIPLLRIPYWDFDKIEEILQSELHKYNLLKDVINL